MIFIDTIQKKSYSKTRSEKKHWSWSMYKNIHFRNFEKISIMITGFKKCSYSFSRSKFRFNFR